MDVVGGLGEALRTYLAPQHQNYPCLSQQLRSTALMSHETSASTANRRNDPHCLLSLTASKPWTPLAARKTMISEALMVFRQHWDIDILK